MRFAKLNSITLHYGHAGDPARPTIVFSNSLGTDFRIWQAVAAELVKDFHIVLYDKRGHGLSDTPKGPYSIDDHVSDLIALIDHLKIDRVIVCGVSVGGMIAQGMAARAPQRIRGLVLCDTAHKIGSPEMWQQRMDQISQQGLVGIADDVMQRWFSSDFIDHQKPQLNGYYNMFTRSPVEGYLGTCAAIRDADLTLSTERIQLPTLCVCGDHDLATTPDLVRELAGLISGARFELVAGAGHLPSVEQPETLVKLIGKFLGEQNFGRAD